MRHRVRPPLGEQPHHTRARISSHARGPATTLLGGLSLWFNHVNPDTVWSHFYQKRKYELPCFGGKKWTLVKLEVLSEIGRFNTNIAQAIYDHLIMKYETLQDINTSYQAEKTKTATLRSEVEFLNLKLKERESELSMVRTELGKLVASNEECKERNSQFYDQITACKEEYRVCNVNFTNATAELKSVQQSIQENSILLRECRSSLARELKQHTDKHDKRPEKERRLQNLLSTMETENSDLSKRLKDASKLIQESKLGNDKKQHLIQILRKNGRALRGRKEPEKKQFVHVDQKERELWINEKAKLEEEKKQIAETARQALEANSAVRREKLALEAEKKSVEDKLAEKSAARREKQALEAQNLRRAARIKLVADQISRRRKRGFFEKLKRRALRQTSEDIVLSNLLTPLSKE